VPVRVRRRWKRRLRFGEVVVVLSLLTAVLALALTLFLRSYYDQKSRGYQPLDIVRGKQLEQNQGPGAPMYPDK